MPTVPTTTVRSRLLPGVVAVLALASAAAPIWAADPAPGGVFVPPGQPAPTPQPTAPAPGTAPGPRGTTITFPTGLYDEKTPGMTFVMEAAAKAKKDNKRVLIMLGENLCSFCVFLMDTLKNDPTVKPIVESEFVIAKVNIGKSFRENADVLSKYGVNFFAQTADGRGVGAPALCIVDPVNDKAVAFIGGNAMVAMPMTMDRPFDERKIAEFLFNNKAPAKPAQPTVDAAKAAMAKANRPGLAVFIAPGNDPSSRVQAWLARTDVTRVLDKHFEVAVIDTERTIGGYDVLKQTTGDNVAISPLLAVVNSEFKPAGDKSIFKSVPKTEEAIKQFVDALAAANAKLTTEDQKTLTEAFKAVYVDQPAK